MDESRLIWLINHGNLSHGEKKCAEHMHYQFFVVRNPEQVKLAYYSYQGYLNNLRSNQSSTPIHPELAEEMEKLFINLRSLPTSNQKA